MSRRTSSGSRSGFAMVQWSVIDDMRLDRSDLAVYLALKRFADARGGCWPSISEIARKARMSRSQCFNSIARLASFGYIKKRTVPGRSNFYELVDLESLYRSYLQAEPVDRAEPRADEAPTAEDYAAGGLVDGDCADEAGMAEDGKAAGIAANSFDAPSCTGVAGASGDAGYVSGEMSMATEAAVSVMKANENDTTFSLKAKVPTVARTAEETTSLKGNDDVVSLIAVDGDDASCDRASCAGDAMVTLDSADVSDVAMAARPFPMSLRAALSLALPPSDDADGTMAEDDLECHEQASSAGMSEEDDAWEAACPGWDSLEDASLSYEDALFDGIDDFSGEERCPFDDDPHPGDLPVHHMNRGVHYMDGCYPSDLPVHPMDRGGPPTGQGCPPIGRGCPPIGHEVYTLSRTNKNNHEPDAGPGGAAQVRAPGWIEGLPESVKDARVMEACDELSDLSDLGGVRRFKTDGEEPSRASSAPAAPVSALCAGGRVRGEAYPVTSDTEGGGSPEYRGTRPFVENAPRGDGATGTGRDFPVDEAEGCPEALSLRGDFPVTVVGAEAIEIVKAKAAPSAGDNASAEAMKAAGDETASAMVTSNHAVADEPVGAANRLTPGTASPADAGAIETSNAADDDAAMFQDEAAVAGHPVLATDHAEAGSSKMPFGIPCGAASFDDAAERVVTGVQAQPSPTTGGGDRTQAASEAAMAVGHGVSQCEGSPENPTSSAHAGGQGTLSLDESEDSAGRKGSSLVKEAEGNAVSGKAHAAMSAKGKASATAAKAATPAGHSVGTPCDPSGQEQLSLPGSETSSEQVRGAQDRLSRWSTMTAADRALSGQATVPARHSPLSTQDAFFTQKSATPEATPGKDPDARAPLTTRRPSRLKLPLQDDFEAWYSLYPVHKNKWEANKEYLAQRASGVEAKLLLDARDELIRRCREDGRAKRYIPRADTFLRGKWRSYLPEAVATLERSFDEFWAMWPGLPEGRDGARREWARRFRALSDPDDRNRALALIAEQVAQLRDRVDSGTDPRYLPRAKNFIRDADFGTRLE